MFTATMRPGTTRCRAGSHFRVLSRSPRPQRLLTSIQWDCIRSVSFRARVTATHARFKLGQDERPDVRADILAGLADTAQQPLLEAMTRVG